MALRLAASAETSSRGDGCVPLGAAAVTCDEPGVGTGTGMREDARRMMWGSKDDARRVPRPEDSG